jgi:acid stress chaperone HdeB
MVLLICFFIHAQMESWMRAGLLASGICVFLATTPVQAQVTVDVSKITCHQYLTFAVADPRDIAIWLSGYYHGKVGDAVLEPQQLKQNYEKLRSACFNPQNSNLPVAQVAEKIFGLNK